MILLQLQVYWVLHMKVDFLSVVHPPPDGSLHQIPVKSQEPGTVETMQTQEHNKSLDAPDGLCLH